MWVEKHGKTFRIRDRIAGEIVTVASGFRTKTVAKDRIDLLKADRLRGEALVPRGDETLLNDWLDAWLPAYEVSIRGSSAHSELGRIRNHIQPLLGYLPLGDIDQLRVQRWVADLVKGVGPMGGTRGRRPLSAKTIRNCHGLLYTIMQAAVTAKLVRTNPCADTKLPKRIRKEMRFLTDPEIVRLIRAMPPHWRPLVLLLVGTGLRWGEAIGLKVKNVDLLAKKPKVVILEQLQEMASTGELKFTEPKTDASRRTVTLTLQVALALTPLIAGKGREETVFKSPRGDLVRTRNFRRTWQKAIKKAGLEGLRIHDLRHTHAALLISDGRSLTAVQRRLGHSSIAVTSDLYGHLREEVDEGILGAIDSALSGVDLDAMSAEVVAELEGEFVDA